MFGFARVVGKTEPTTAELLIAEYGRIMGEKASCIEPADRLPAAKPLLKAALLEALRNPRNSGKRGKLKKAYELLASYQVMSKDEAEACRIMSAPRRPARGSEEERLAIIAFIPVAGAWENLQKRVEQESAELALEMRMAGVH